MAGYDLDAIKARLAHVTPGRWEASRTADTEETSLEWLKACLIAPEAPAKNMLNVIWATDQPGVIIPAVTGDGPTSSQNAEFIAHAPEDIAALVAEVEDLRANPRDEHHTMDELYDYRMLYHAAAVNAWVWSTVKSWRHSDGEPCFGGGWFIVVTDLPTGQISNHYKAEYWDLFQVPEAVIPPKYDGHTPQIAAERLREWLQA
jgi:hypothetical protein